MCISLRVTVATIASFSDDMRTTRSTRSEATTLQHRQDASIVRVQQLTLRLLLPHIRVVFVLVVIVVVVVVVILCTV